VSGLTMRGEKSSDRPHAIYCCPAIIQMVSMTMTIATNCNKTRICIRYCERQGLPPRIMFMKPSNRTAATEATAIGIKTWLRNSVMPVLTARSTNCVGMGRVPKALVTSGSGLDHRDLRDATLAIEPNRSVRLDRPAANPDAELFVRSDGTVQSGPIPDPRTPSSPKRTSGLI
jgi:hypothetical protein